MSVPTRPTTLPCPAPCPSRRGACGGKQVLENIPKNRDIAYSMAKAETEKLLYAESEGSGAAFECMSILPMHVVGPVMAKNHDQPGSWQFCVKRMMEGRDHPMGLGGRMFWNMVDVRGKSRPCPAACAAACCPPC